MAMRPHDPTSNSKPDGRGEAPPPAPPSELPRIAIGATERTFEANGQRWTARLAGKGAAGTGSYGLGLIEAVHFADAAQPHRPLREALLARGRFDNLFDSELAALLDRATPIVRQDSR